jgi:hypothetical protein
MGAAIHGPHSFPQKEELEQPCEMSVHRLVECGGRFGASGCFVVNERTTA